MKKLLNIGMMGVLVLLISFNHAYPQADSETLMKKEAQTEIAPDSGSYVIGPEDVLYIHVWREETLTRSVPVRMDGKISLPLIDEIYVAGLTPLKLKEVLVERYKKFIDNPNVFVMVMEANSAKVFVSGQVTNSGVIRLKSETTLAQVIALAGGFTGWANQRKILIIRKVDGKEKRMTVNYRKILNGDLSSNIIVKPGDTIIVP